MHRTLLTKATIPVNRRLYNRYWTGGLSISSTLAIASWELSIEKSITRNNYRLGINKVHAGSDHITESQLRVRTFHSNVSMSVNGIHISYKLQVTDRKAYMRMKYTFRSTYKKQNGKTSSLSIKYRTLRDLPTIYTCLSGYLSLSTLIERCSSLAGTLVIIHLMAC
jgi:hypothetical protein